MTDSKKGFWQTTGNYYRGCIQKMRDSNASRWLMAIVILLFLILLFLGIENILDQGTDASGQVYKAIGFGMVMVWVCIFICYFIWAVYFYNLNYGYSRKVWKKIEEAKQNRSKGLAYKQEDIDEEPKYNPYKNETFGLPGGTVRGMIAFTLLFGSIAMLIVSFGMKNEIQGNGFFIDQFDFFKKAFLMMIAFYFGNHSLKYLKPAEPKQLVETEPQTETSKLGQNQTEIVVVHPEKDEDSDNEGIKPITATDPMAPKG